MSSSHPTPPSALPAAAAAVSSSRSRLPRRSTGGRHLRAEPACSGDRTAPATPAMAWEELRAAVSRSGDLPLDALREILLRLSAKELCRLRAVSPTWRLAVPHLRPGLHRRPHGPPLEAAPRLRPPRRGPHPQRRPRGPLWRARQADAEERGRHRHARHSPRPRLRREQVPAHGSLGAEPGHRCCSRVALVPLGVHGEWAGRAVLLWLRPCGAVCQYAFGRVSTKGEYKALRITRGFLGDPNDKICEVITIDADGRNHGVWREMQRPPSLICTGDAVSRDSSISDEMKCVVVDGVVHFMIDFKTIYFNSMEISVEPGSIASFNLETEEWMPTLRGPAPVRSFLRDNIRKYSYFELDVQLSLSELHGSLVTVHNIHYSSMDLWFLSDFKKGLWVKKYSLPSQVTGLLVYPLLVLDDERVLLMQGTDSLVCFGLKTGIYTYDLKTGAYTHELDLEMGSFDWGKSIGVYTGSLLSP